MQFIRTPKTARLAPNTVFRLFNPLSPKKRVASSRSYSPRAYVPGGSSTAVAGAVQRAGSPKTKTSQVKRQAEGTPTQTTSPVTGQSIPPAPAGWMISGNCADYPTCSVIDLVPLRSTAQ
jgi:hypothetical protein